MSRTTTRIVAAGLAGLALAAAGCSSNDDDKEASGKATTPPATTAPAADGSGASAGGNGDGCPATTETLYAALKSSRDIVSRLPDSLTGLQNPSCYQGWAVARTVVTNMDRASVVFRYRSGQWTAVNLGTANFCEDVVPAAIIPKLAGCRGA